jgi:hypothetical protein
MKCFFCSKKKKEKEKRKREIWHVLSQSQEEGKFYPFSPPNAAEHLMSLLILPVPPVLSFFTTSISSSLPRFLKLHAALFLLAILMIL